MDAVDGGYYHLAGLNMRRLLEQVVHGCFKAGNHGNKGNKDKGDASEKGLSNRSSLSFLVLPRIEESVLMRPSGRNWCHLLTD